MPVSVLCQTCQKSFFVPPSRIPKGAKYCSSQCYFRRNGPFWSRINTSSGPDVCWPWLASCNSGGYGSICIDGKTCSAHRIAYVLTYGDILPLADLQVLHSCDNPPCCNPAHLFLGTHLDNIQDKVRKGRQSAMRGEAHPSAKLTASDIPIIRGMQGQMTLQQAASVYEVHLSTIAYIWNKKHWKHI